jgi:nucleotide-binding universal stress UspA family protein
MPPPPPHVTLLVGYDGSDRGRDAVALSRLPAAGFDARLVVAVVHPFDRLLAGDATPPTPAYDFEATAREQAEEVAGQARALLEAHKGVDVRVVGSASPAEALYDLAGDLDAAAVVVGSSHRAAVGRIAPGSVAEALLSGAPCPVAIAPAEFAARASRTLVSIGAAYDESDEAARALAFAERFAARLHAGLTIVSVALAAEHRQALAARLEDVVGAAPAAIAASAEVRVGDPCEELREAGRDLDLLVCGSRRYGPVRRVLLGSVTARLVRDAPCPVLVLPRGAEGPLAEDLAAAPGSAERIG